jgi:hypothetical protein
MCSRKLIGYLGFFHLGVFIGEGAMSEGEPGALTRLGKIRLQELVLSNSENISYVSLLKHKNSKKQETGTMATC